MRTYRKARKEHECSNCDKPIAKGEMYFSDRYRVARYDEFDRQVGIQFQQYSCHGENCQAGDPEYFWNEAHCLFDDEHDLRWRGPMQMERYCNRCMRLESQLYPDMHRWGLVPTGIKSWQHPVMTVTEIRATRYNMLIAQLNIAIRVRNVGIARMESEIALQSSNRYDTNIDLQWKINSTLINVEGILNQNKACNESLQWIFTELLRFFRQLHHESYKPRLEFTVSNNSLFDQFKKITLV